MSTGKKAKHGKNRLDKFYHLARESGYRSRAAFKLIQLNKPHDFLGRAKVLVDLCAAPGGWLQVAAKFMPLGSKIIGVDLDPIKQIPNVDTFVDDITKPSCVKTIKKLAGNRKADVVLHDGAPNMGTSWTLDAYAQVELVLHSLSVATQTLAKDGWFITKIFRSSEYNAILYVAQQFFKKVAVTKPEASRGASAEIYFVCQGYLAPTKIDPRLLDPKEIFGVSDPSEPILGKIPDLTWKGQKKKNSAQGYDQQNGLLFKKLPAKDFLQSSRPINLLADNNVITFEGDSAVYLDHPLTTADVRDYCSDVRALGKREFGILLKWRLKLNDYYNKLEEKEEQEPEEKTLDPQEEMAKLLQARMETLSKAEKRIKRKAEIAKKKLLLRIKLGINASLEGIKDANGDEDGMFAVNNIDNADTLEKITNPDDDDEEEADMSADDNSEEEFEDDNPSDDELEGLEPEQRELRELEKSMDNMYELYLQKQTKRKQRTSKRVKLVEQDLLDQHKAEKDHGIEDNPDHFVDVEAPSSASEAEDAPPLRKSKLNELVLESRRASKRTQMNNWFSNEAFANIEGNLADDFEQLVKSRKRVMDEASDEEALEAVAPRAKKSKTEKANGSVGNGLDGYDGNTMDIQDDAPVTSDEEADVDLNFGSIAAPEAAQADDGDFEVVDQESDLEEASSEYVETSESDTEDEARITEKAKRLAVGALLLRKKSRRDLEDDMWNRYTHNETGLPEWFQEEERMFYKPMLPITREQIADMKARWREINARPIKKVAEAQERKRKRAAKREKAAKEKANKIVADTSLNTKDKVNSIQKIMKKAEEVRKERIYVRSTRSSTMKGINSKKGQMKNRRAGANARVRLVDGPMKKEARARARREGGKSGKSKKGGHNKGRK